MDDQFGTDNSSGHFFPKSLASLNKTAKEFPPAIPSLVRTKKYIGCPHPCVMHRYCTNDGRLIIKGEYVHQEYLKINRSNGRLTMKLVLLKNDALVKNEEEESECNVDSTTNETTAIDGGEGRCDGGSGGAKFCYELMNNMGVSGLSVSPSKAVRIGI